MNKSVYNTWEESENMCKSLIRNSLVSKWVTQMMTQSSSIPTSIIPGLDHEIFLLRAVFCSAHWAPPRGWHPSCPGRGGEGDTMGQHDDPQPCSITAAHWPPLSILTIRLLSLSPKISSPATHQQVAAPLLGNINGCFQSSFNCQ